LNSGSTVNTFYP